MGRYHCLEPVSQLLFVSVRLAWAVTSALASPKAVYGQDTASISALLLQLTKLLHLVTRASLSIYFLSPEKPLLNIQIIIRRKLMKRSSALLS